MEHFLVGLAVGVIAITAWDKSVVGNTALHELFNRVMKKFKK